MLPVAIHRHYLTHACGVFLGTGDFSCVYVCVSLVVNLVLWTSPSKTIHTWVQCFHPPGGATTLNPGRWQQSAVLIANMLYLLQFVKFLSPTSNTEPYHSYLYFISTRWLVNKHSRRKVWRADWLFHRWFHGFWVVDEILIVSVLSTERKECSQSDCLLIKVATHRGGLGTVWA